MAWLVNATFDNPLAGSANDYFPWQSYDYGSPVTLAVVRDGTAMSGSAFLRARTTRSLGSVSQDVTIGGIGGGAQSGYSLGVYAWVRAAVGAAPVSGFLVIWELSPQGSNNHPSASFTVGNSWVRVSNAISLVNPGYLRVAFYLSTVNADLDIDCVIAA
jgi:hypothetical protein